MTRPINLVIAGGGTGGHLFPGIAIAEALMELEPQSKVLFVGTERGIEATKVPAAGFDLECIDVSGLKRVGGMKQLQTLVKLPLSLVQSLQILRKFKADAVIGVGGYASGPVVMAAKMLTIPTAVCEQNSVPGVTNSILGKMVRRVFGTFPSSAPHFPAQKFDLVGNPVRRSFVAAAKTPAPPVIDGRIFVFGGSQGARPLNEAVPAALGILKERGHSVDALHQAGKNDVEAVRERYLGRGVDADVTPFIDEMVDAYRSANVVICRAGATSCAEIAALGVPAIFVPFPQAADDHQTTNARDMTDQDAGVLLPQTDMTPEHLADLIEPFLVDKDYRNRMAQKAQDLGRLDAADVIATSAMDGFPKAARVARKPQLRTAVAK